MTARLTSYGLNNYLTRSVSPTGKRDPIRGVRFRQRDYPWQRLLSVPRPSGTVHFLQMARSAAKCGKPDATEALVGMVEHLAAKGQET